MTLSAPVRLAIGLFGVTLAGALALTARSMRRHPPLPVLGHVPSFHLIDERATPFGTESMLGHVSVVDFIFTRCTSSCPRLTARMAELQQRFGHAGADVRLVSFSVDPENDTPAVLAAYAAKAGADAARWTFVTGPVDDIARAVVLGFKVSAAKVASGAGDDDVTHGDWLVLVDRKGDLRGYYPTEQPEEFQALIDDVMRLARDTT
jgi:protein SCO1/2